MDTILDDVFCVMRQRLNVPAVSDFLGGSGNKNFLRNSFLPSLDGLDNQTSLHYRLLQLMVKAESAVRLAQKNQPDNPERRVQQCLDQIKHWFCRAEELLDAIALMPPHSSNSSDHESSVLTLNVTEVVRQLESLMSLTKIRELRPSPFYRVYGRDKEIGMIVDFLSSQQQPQQNNTGVVAIIGEPGTGKTSLAQLAYHHPKLEGAFHPRGYVRAGDLSNLTQVIKSILVSISLQPLSKSKAALSDKLRGNRFLLVLDDLEVEDFQDVELLLAQLSTGANGSKVIVTTRFTRVASAMSATVSVPLKPLSDEDSLLLFSKCALEYQDNDPIPLDIGMQIVNNCKGCPLAIKKLCGLVYATRNIPKWKAISDGSIWELLHNKDLWHSYSRLSGRLKRCFSYCAIFPKAHRIHRKQLVLMWMAEYFIPPRFTAVKMERVPWGSTAKRMEGLPYGSVANRMEGLPHGSRYKSDNVKAQGDLYGPNYRDDRVDALRYDPKYHASMEEEGDRYGSNYRDDRVEAPRYDSKYKDDRVNALRYDPKYHASMEEEGDHCVRTLLSESFLQALDESYVTMSDSMHDLAQVVSGDFIARAEPQSAPEFSEEARHFSCDAAYFDETNILKTIGKAKYLRSFLMLGNIDYANSEDRLFLNNRVTTALIPHLYYLRVLSLSGYEISELPDTIGNLKLLRYLDVSCTKIKNLPESVSTLYNLQTLLLSGCDSLVRLPKDTRKWIHLRHLDITGTTSLLEMPMMMSKLKSLQTLTSFVVGNNSGSNIAELRELHNIHGKFELRRLQNIATPNDAFQVNLHKMNLSMLALEFDFEENHDDVKDGQVQLLDNLRPHTNLEELSIVNYGGMKFPYWLDPECEAYRSMTVLRLSGCRYCHSLPPLGQLLSLKQLEIEGMDNITTVGPEFYGHNPTPFKVLESLSFQNMKAWEVWSNVDAKGRVVFFPSLRKLFIHDCPKLKGNFPVRPPSRPPLPEEISIHECVELAKLRPQVALKKRRAYQYPGLQQMAIVPRIPVAVSEAGQSGKTVAMPEVMSDSSKTYILTQEEEAVEVAELMHMHQGLQVGLKTSVEPDVSASVSITRIPVTLSEQQAGPSDETVTNPEMISTLFEANIRFEEEAVEVTEQKKISHNLQVGLNRLVESEISASDTISEKNDVMELDEGMIPRDCFLTTSKRSPTYILTEEEEAVEVAEQMHISQGLLVGLKTPVEPDISVSASIPGPEAGPSDGNVAKPEMISTVSEAIIPLQEEGVKVTEKTMISHDLQVGLVEADISASVSISGPSLETSVNPEIRTTTSLQTHERELGSHLSVQVEGIQRKKVRTLPKVNTERPIGATVKNILVAFRNKSRIICLYGRAGSGKSTVLRTLSHHPSAKHLFDQIIFVSIPRFDRRRKMQSQIAQQLSLNVEQFSSEEETAAQIRIALSGRRQKVLLLLDDVLETMNLDEVGMPTSANDGCWLVFTTRYLDVSTDMVSREIEMEVLSTVEAIELLRYQVGEIVDSPEFEQCARDIAEECNGLPLIIIAVASALKMESTVKEWKHALSLFSNSSNSSNLFPASPHVKYCYDRLGDDDAKACFLYCALFESDEEIDISVLVDCFFVEGLLGVRKSGAYKKGHDIVRHLINAYLLEAMSNGCKVKMHNVIRDSALEILSSNTKAYKFLTGSYLRANTVPKSVMLSRNIGKYLTSTCAQLKGPLPSEEWAQAEMICLMDNGLSRLPCKPSCPTLGALFLQRNNCLRIIPTSFFDSMDALKILNLSKTRIKCLSDSFSKLKSLQVLVLRDCQRLSMLPTCIGCLKALEVLDLQGTELTHLPESVGELASLKQLRVSFYGSIYHREFNKLPTKLIPEGVISRLTDLRELGFFVPPGDQRWESGVTSIIEEINNLKLSSLFFYFPDEKHLDHFLRGNASWKQGKLSTFNLIVGNDYKHALPQVSYDAEMMHNGEERGLRFVNGENMPPAVLEVLSHVTSFYLDHHLNICNLSDFGINIINKLKICILRDCPQIRVIVDSIACSHSVFPILECLSINYAWKLERVWVGQVIPGSLARLRYLSLQSCPNLRYVLTASMLDILHNLEELMIEDCESLNYIVIEDEVAVDDAKNCIVLEKPRASEISNIISGIPVLRSLKVLKLHTLPNLCGIWKARWPPLEYLSLYDCPMLKNLRVEENDAMSIKEIAADMGWWDNLQWDNEDVSMRLKECVIQFNLDDL